jgi:hypothetical protein
MAFHHSPKLVTNGLIFCIDSANPKSFNNPFDDVVFDLTGNYDCALPNGPT